MLVTDWIGGSVLILVCLWLVGCYVWGGDDEVGE